MDEQPKTEERLSLDFEAQNNSPMGPSEDTKTISQNSKITIQHGSQNRKNESSQDAQKQHSKYINDKAKKLEQELLKREFSVQYSRRVISFCFVLIFFGNVFCNIDHGTLPGCSTKLMEDIGINELQYGTLGSIVYAGIVIGTLMCSFVFSRQKLIKTSIILTLSLNSVALFSFTLTKSFYFDAFLRLMIGFFQVFICVYMPVWADTFAKDEKQKSAWITFLVLATPLGIVIGFSLASVMVQQFNHWEYAFYIQSMGLIPVVVGFICIPSKYYELENAQKFKIDMYNSVLQKLQDHIDQDKNMNSQNVQQQEFDSILKSMEDNLLTGSSVQNFEKDLKQIKKQCIKFLDNSMRIERKHSNAAVSFSSDQKQSTWGKLKSILSNRMYLYCCLGLTGLQYVVTGIQYWCANYLETVIGEDPAVVSWYFSLTSATSPVGGVIIGGVVMQWLGGYQTKKASYILMTSGLLAAACAIPIPFLSEFYTVASLYWGLLFFGGFVLPPMTGIMIGSVGAFQRSQAMSTATLIYNLCGYLPGPLIYGVISEFSENHSTSPYKNRFAMAALLYACIIADIFMICGLRMNMKRIKRRKSDRANSSLMMLSQVSYVEEDDEDEFRVTQDFVLDEQESPNMVLEAEENKPLNKSAINMSPQNAEQTSPGQDQM